MISIAAGIERNAAQHPDKVAIRSAFGQMTYAELREAALAVHDAIIETREGGPHIFASLAGNTTPALVALIGARYADEPLVLLDTKMPTPEIAARCASMNVTTVFSDGTAAEETLGELSRSGLRVIDTQRVIDEGRSARGFAEGTPNLALGSSADAPIWHAPSGGSSGVLRAIALSESASLFRFASQTIEFGLDRSSSFLLCAPLIHGGGRSFAVGQLYGGGTLELHQKFQVDDVLDALEHVQGAFLVPTMLARLIQTARWREVAARTSTVVVLSGGRLDDELAAEASRGFSGRMFNYFGSTEAGSVSVTEYRDGQRRTAGDLGVFTVGCVGRVLPLPAGHSLADTSGDVGQLLVKTHGTCLWSLDIASGERVAAVDGFWDHRDVVRVLEDGSLGYIGRADDMIVTGGVNIYPAEVVDALESIDGVETARVLGLRSAEWGEIVAAVAVASSAMDVESLRAALRSRVRPAAMPKALVLVEEIPLNAMGKVDGSTLRRLLDEAGQNWIDRRGAGGRMPATTARAHR